MTKDEFLDWSDRMSATATPADIDALLVELRQLPDDRQRQDLLRMAYMLRERLPV